MAKELKNTLLVDGQEYNINSKVAEKVNNALTVNKSTIVADDENYEYEINYDGSEAKSLIIVPADGGKFTGEIRVPANKDATLDGETVLNYSDLKNNVFMHLLNHSTLYTWSGDTTNLEVFAKGAISGISIIFGLEENLDSFVLTNNKRYMDNMTDNTISYFSVYLYVCEGSFNIYYGTALAGAFRLAANAETAEVTSKLEGVVTEGNQQKVLSYTAEDIKKIIDDVANAIESVDNVIDGTTTIESAKNAFYIETVKAITANKIVYNAPLKGSDLADILIYYNTRLDNIVNGTVTVGKATNATNAESATKATGDGDGKTIKNTYYQSVANQSAVNKIYITAATKTEPETNGIYNTGDIWIKYSN